MTPKLLALTVMMACVAGGLLVLRQHRVETAHEIAVLHRDARDARVAVWQAQAEAGRLLNPARLHQQLQTRQIAVEPDTPTPLGPAEPQLVRRPVDADAPTERP